MYEEKRLLKAAVVLLLKEDNVLLAMKKKKIGKGRWNGYGGGPDPSESIVDCAVRELAEETKCQKSGECVIVRPDQLTKMAVIDFINHPSEAEPFTCRVSVFTATEWLGQPHETDEMGTPTWFPFHRLPVENMMPADPAWLRLVLNGVKFCGIAKYGPRQSKLIGPTKLLLTDNLPEDDEPFGF